MALALFNFVNIVDKNKNSDWKNLKLKTINPMTIFYQKNYIYIGLKGIKPSVAIKTLFFFFFISHPVLSFMIEPHLHIQTIFFFIGMHQGITPGNIVGLILILWSIFHI